jgi:hypothetical protein
MCFRTVGFQATRGMRARGGPAQAVRMILGALENGNRSLETLGEAPATVAESGHHRKMSWGEFPEVRFNVSTTFFGSPPKDE